MLKDNASPCSYATLCAFPLHQCTPINKHVLMHVPCMTACAWQPGAHATLPCMSQTRRKQSSSIPDPTDHRRPVQSQFTKNESKMSAHLRRDTSLRWKGSAMTRRILQSFMHARSICRLSAARLHPLPPYGCVTPASQHSKLDIPLSACQFPLAWLSLTRQKNPTNTGLHGWQLLRSSLH